MPDTKMEIIISAKDRASRVVKDLKRNITSASQSMTSALQGGGTFFKGGIFGTLAGGVDMLTGAASALVPEVALPLQIVGSAAKGVLLVFRQVASTVGTIVAGAFNLALNLIERVVKAAWELGGRALQAVIRGLRGVGMAALAAGAALGYMVKSTVDAAAYLEQANIAYGSLLKSQALGAAFVGQLQQFAKETPFEFKDLLTLGRTVLAYGFAWQQVIPVLRSVGDATAALGGGPDMMERILRAIGQIQGKGKVMMQEMYQLAEAGIPVFEIFATKLGLTQEQVARIGETGISAAQALPALFAGLSERYGGLMTAQMGTVAGQVSNLQDLFFQAKASIGQAFLPLVKAWLPVLQAQIGGLGPRLAGMAQRVIAFFSAFGQSKLVLSILGRLRYLFDQLTARLGPVQRLWGVFGGVVNWLADRFNNLLGWIIRLWEWLKSPATTSALTAFGAKLKQMWSDLPGAVSRALQWIRTEVPKALAWLLTSFAKLIVVGYPIFSFFMLIGRYMAGMFAAVALAIMEVVQALALLKGDRALADNIQAAQDELRGMVTDATKLAKTLEKGIPLGVMQAAVDMAQLGGQLAEYSRNAGNQPLHNPLPPLPEIPAPPMPRLVPPAPPVAPELPPVRITPSSLLPPRGPRPGSFEWDVEHGRGETPPTPSGRDVEHGRGESPPTPSGRDEEHGRGETPPTTSLPAPEKVAMRPINVYLMAPVYGVEDLENAIAQGIYKAERSARYQGQAVPA